MRDFKVEEFIVGTDIELYSVQQETFINEEGKQDSIRMCYFVIEDYVNCRKYYVNDKIKNNNIVLAIPETLYMQAMMDLARKKYTETVENYEPRPNMYSYKLRVLPVWNYEERGVPQYEFKYRTFKDKRRYGVLYSVESISIHKYK